MNSHIYESLPKSVPVVFVCLSWKGAFRMEDNEIQMELFADVKEEFYEISTRNTIFEC